ncbi:hypothetical protein P9112_006969 [Eukaryota sp. TZLM1-RC]
MVFSPPTKQPRLVQSKLLPFVVPTTALSVLSVPSVEDISNNMTSPPNSPDKLNSVLVSAFPDSSLVDRPSTYNIVDKAQQLEVVLWMRRNQRSAPQAVRHHSNLKLTTTSVKNWRTTFNSILQELIEIYSTQEEALEATKQLFLREKQRGRPTLLPTQQHKELIDLIKAVRLANGRVTAVIIQSLARAVMKSSGLDARLKENGGGLILSERWARGILENTL